MKKQLQWYDNMAVWRRNNKHIDADWDNYASARTDQTNILSACFLVIGLMIGYFGRGNL